MRSRTLRERAGRCCFVALDTLDIRDVTVRRILLFSRASLPHWHGCDPAR